jgi:Kef-type K+ transport system membrane component KefB
MDTLGLLLAIAIIIVAAKSAGYLSIRLHQPAVLGELLMGLILGPTVINLFALDYFAHGHVEETVLYLAEMGVIFLMFMAGLEIDLSEMRKVGLAAVVVGTMGVIVPLILGSVTSLLFGFPLVSAIFIGLILTATSVSISAQTLMELGLLRTTEGLTLLAAAVVDDILVILILSTDVALNGSGGGLRAGDLLLIAARMAVYLAAAVAIGVLVLPRLVRRVSRLPISEGVIATVIVAVFLYAWAAEAIGGMAAITGAFIAGLMLSSSVLRERIEEGMHTITYGLFVPIFFVSIGLKADGRALNGEDMLFTIAIVLVAVIGKVLGCGLGARISGLSGKQSLRVGVGMVSRGEVGLIVASVGLSVGLIPDKVFATMVIVVLVTTLLTPILLRSAFQERGKEKV